MSQIKIEVTERGIDQTDRKLKKLGDTGGKTELQINEVKNSIKLVGQKGAQSIALLDGPLGGVSSRVSSLTQLLGSGAGGLAGAMAATTAAAYATTAAMATMVIETDNFARVAGVSVEQFNQMSFAAGQFGLTAEQLGDAFKDTRERIGDFIATGGGPLQDFADVMGYTKEQTLAFAQSVEGLSGRDVLVEMVRQLEEGGKSSEQMSFALEGMANDMTKLLPLLTNGASELDRLESKMAAVQSPLSQEDINKFREFNESIDLVAASFSNMMTNAVIPLLEPFTQLNEAVAFFISTTNEGSENALAMQLVDLNERSKELSEAIKDNETAWGRFTNVATFESTDTEVLKKQLEEVNKQIDETRAKLTAMRTGGTPTPTSAGSAPALPAPTTAPSTATPTVGNNADQINSQLEAIRMSYMTQEQLAQAKLQKDLEIIELSKIAEQERIDLSVLAYEAYYEKLDELDQQRTQKANSEAEKRAKEEERTARQAARAEQIANDERIDALGNVTNSLRSSLGEQNALYKAAAITNTTIATYESATQAYKALAGIPVVGPALGAAAAGVAIGSGLANVAAIQGARFQGGDVSGGSGYQWQERGGEAFIPKVDGRVFSKNDMRSMMNGEGSSGVTLVNNIYNQSGANVTSVPNDQGGEDIYITRDEFPSLVAAEIGNPDSEAGQAGSSTYVWSRA